MSSLEHIGQKLKAAREGRGLTLGQIYDKTKIPTSNLKAIESADYEQLPEPVYVAGFIKRYADCVGLNGQSLSDEYKQHIEESNSNGRSLFAGFGHKNKAVAVQPQPIISPQLSKVTIEPPRPGVMKTIFWPGVLILIVLTGIVILMGYQQQRYLQLNDPSILAMRENLSKFNNVQPSNLPVATGSSTNASNKPMDTNVSINDKDCRIALSANQHVWVEVKSVATGESKFTGFLEAGDRRDFQDDQGLKVVAGNGASLTVAYRGKSETFGAAGKKTEREFRSANTTTAGVPIDASAIMGTGDATAIKPAVIKRPKKTDGVKRPKSQPIHRNLDDVPTRYIPGESSGGTRSIGVPYRYTEGRLDSD